MFIIKEEVWHPGNLMTLPTNPAISGYYDPDDGIILLREIPMHIINTSAINNDYFTKIETYDIFFNKVTIKNHNFTGNEVIHFRYVVNDETR